MKCALERICQSLRCIVIVIPISDISSSTPIFQNLTYFALSCKLGLKVSCLLKTASLRYCLYSQISIDQLLISLIVDGDPADGSSASISSTVAGEIFYILVCPSHCSTSTSCCGNWMLKICCCFLLTISILWSCWRIPLSATNLFSTLLYIHGRV